jgi:CheY-like chemotaxis protein
MNAPADSADNRRVLLIHPNSAYAESCESLLESAGFQVTLASNSQEALDRVSNERYGVVVLPPSMARREERRMCAKFSTLPRKPFAFQIRYPTVAPTSVVDFVKHIASLC